MLVIIPTAEEIGIQDYHWTEQVLAWYHDLLTYMSWCRATAIWLRIITRITFPPHSMAWVDELWISILQLYQTTGSSGRLQRLSTSSSAEIIIPTWRSDNKKNHLASGGIRGSLARSPMKSVSLLRILRYWPRSKILIKNVTSNIGHMQSIKCGKKYCTICM